MEVNLSKVKVTYGVREVVLVLTFIAGLAGHVIRTELMNESLQRQMAEIRLQLENCEKRLTADEVHRGR
jgi:hypothetical protein